MTCVLNFQSFAAGLAAGVLAVAVPTAAEIAFQPRALPGSTATVGADFGNGVCAVDYDQDGDIDLYMTDGDGRPNRLYRNDGAWTFVEVANALGAAHGGEAKGAAFADYDRDGDLDLVVSCWACPNVLYEQVGGAFVDVTQAAGILDESLYSTGVAWGDADGDGWLDLYVANRGPDQLGEPNRLYINQADGTFVEEGTLRGVDSWRMTFQPLWTDFDADGDVDLHLASDRHTINQLFENLGGTFVDVAGAVGADLDMDGMGINSAELNGDGLPDYYVTNTQAGNRCLMSQPGGTYIEDGWGMGVAVGDVGWGAVFPDVDLDGRVDLFAVNMFAPGNVLFRSTPTGFVDVTATAGVSGNASSFGATTADLDGDGDFDLVVSNRDAECELYENISDVGGAITVRLRGVQSNRSGIGARVRLLSGGVEQVQELFAGSSYLSQTPGALIFGIGQAAFADSLTVEWPSSRRSVLGPLFAGASVLVVEDEVAGTALTPAVGAPAARLAVAPNPVRLALNIHTDLEGAVEVSMYSVRGRLMGRQPALVTGGRAHLELGALAGPLARGVAFLEVVSAAGERRVARVQLGR